MNATLYTLAEAAAILRVKPHVIVYLLTSKKVPEPLRVGHRRLFTVEDLARIDAFLSRTLAARYGRGPNAAG